jgi:hypothetical protein
MTKLPRDRPGKRGRDEVADAPRTSTEEEASRRRAGADADAARESRMMDEHDFKRQKELNPDDFE